MIPQSNSFISRFSGNGIRELSIYLFFCEFLELTELLSGNKIIVKALWVSRLSVLLSFFLTKSRYIIKTQDICCHMYLLFMYVLTFGAHLSFFHHGTQDMGFAGSHLSKQWPEPYLLSFTQGVGQMCLQHIPCQNMACQKSRSKKLKSEGYTSA